MPEHYSKVISNHKTKELFDIVADVKSYPEFLPWVSGARILEINSKGNWLIAELLVSFKAFSQKYSSKVELFYPEGESKTYKIKTSLVEGPFNYLNNNWIFSETLEGDTEIVFELDFKFNSIILEKLIGGLFQKATNKMAEAFSKRADELLSD